MRSGTRLHDETLRVRRCDARLGELRRLHPLTDRVVQRESALEQSSFIARRMSGAVAVAGVGVAVAVTMAARLAVQWPGWRSW